MFTHNPLSIVYAPTVYGMRLFVHVTNANFKSIEHVSCHPISCLTCGLIAQTSNLIKLLNINLKNIVGVGFSPITCSTHGLVCRLWNPNNVGVYIFLKFMSIQTNHIEKPITHVDQPNNTTNNTMNKKNNKIHMF